MVTFRLLKTSYLLVSGPELDPLECGTPIFCIFYGIISIIFLFAVYSNIKGEVGLVYFLTQCLSLNRD